MNCGNGWFEPDSAYGVSRVDTGFGGIHALYEVRYEWIAGYGDGLRWIA